MGDDDVSEPGWHVSRGGKTCGPLSDKQFRLLIKKGKLKSDDLIWRPGFEDWRSADTVLGRSGPPPIPNKQTIQRTPAKGRTWKLGLVAFGVTALVVGFYIASPYYTLWRLKHAVETKDSLALESIVDWPRIRNEIKSEILVASYASVPANSDAFTVLGNALGAPIVGSMIESLVSPAGLIRASENNPEWTEDLGSGHFVGPLAFRADIKEPWTLAPLGLILEFQGTGWSVTHIDLPREELQKALKRDPDVGSPEWKMELDEKFKPSGSAMTKGDKQ